MRAAPTTALLLVAALSGCIQTGPDCSTPAAVERPDRFDGQRLTILDQGAFPTLASVRDAFQNETGARVEPIDGGDAGNALRTALLAAGNPPADLLFGVDNALFFTTGVQDKCLFLPYESPNLDRIDRAQVDVDQFQVDGEQWVTPLDYGYVSVNYDIRLNDSEDDKPPRDLRDLATPRWAPLFVTEDPRTSSPGLGFLIVTISTFGETGDYTWKDYWRDLLRNGALVAKDWTQAYVYHYTGGYGQTEKDTYIGDRQIVVSYTTSPAVEVFFGTPSPPGVSLEPPRGVFHQIETMGILRGSDHVALAQAFIDFALTYEFQNRTAAEMAVYPVARGAHVPQEFRDLATAPEDLEPAPLQAADIGPNLDRWLDEWVTLYRSEQS